MEVSEYTTTSYLSLKNLNNIVFIYPKKFIDNKILKDNIKSTLSIFLNEWIKENNWLKELNNQFYSCAFDLEKQIIKKEIDRIERKFLSTNARMNKNLSPYKWRIIQGLEKENIIDVYNIDRNSAHILFLTI